MHNSVLWLTHAPHHHITQASNAAKGAVGNPRTVPDQPQRGRVIGISSSGAVLCAANVLTAVSSFAHANVRFYTPKWYSLFFFVTVEHQQAFTHSVAFEDTRLQLRQFADPDRSHVRHVPGGRIRRSSVRTSARGCQRSGNSSSSPPGRSSRWSSSAKPRLWPSDRDEKIGPPIRLTDLCSGTAPRIALSEILKSAVQQAAGE